MTIEELKTAVKNLSVYLEECHGERDTVTFTVNVVRSIKVNYEELVKYKEKYEDTINRQKAENDRKTKHIAEIVDEYAKFKEAAKRRETAVVRNIEQVADEEISRLKAEIERLKEHEHIIEKMLSEAWERIAELDRLNETAKSEAIKEFARRARGMITIRGRQKDYFDNLVKEMVGDTECR